MMKNIEFINAGAGSGKTYFLSQKLTEVIANKQCSAEEIILTTFTEVAAAELKNKAREALLRAGQSEQANLLSSAAIGTVHSVALQLIQKYWHHLGVGVKLRVMPEEDKNFFLNQSLAFIPTREELITLDKLSRSLDFQKGINQKDPDHWKNDLLDIIGKALNNRMENLNSSRSASLQEIERIFPIDNNWELDFEMIANLLNDTLRLVKGAARNNTNIARISTAESLINLNGNMGFSDLLKLQSFLSSLPANIYSNFTHNHRDLILQSLGNLQASPILVNGITEYVNLTFDLAEKSIARYRNYKQEHKLIDYNDMEVLFLNLLEKEEARIEISNRFKMVFVDEFQDCSPIQIEIFSKLSELAIQSYWVGDPKQAIYDFRGTDPLLIEAIINNLNTANDNNLTIGERLAESWRSRPQIVALTNNIFTEALADQVDPELIALNAVRIAGELPDDEIHSPLKNWKFKDIKDKNEAFIHHLASEINNLLNNPNIKVVDKSKSKLSINPDNRVIITRPLEAKDVAVLCRTNTRVYELVAALKGFGIQVAAEQKNLTETAEMKLFMALLNYYSDKNDTLAKATIIFLSEPDTSVSGLIDERLEFLYGENAPVRPCVQEEENNADWGNYYQSLNSWGNENIMLQKTDHIRGQSGHLSVSSLVDKLITITGISDLVLLWDNPLQRKNNLQALKKMAVDYENRCLTMEIAATLRGYMESLSFYGNQEIKQGAASGTDAVNVMTYHKSKGLEWPVVILNQLDYDHFSDRNLFAQGFFGVNLDSVGEIDLENPYKGKTIVLMPWPYGALNRIVPTDLKNSIVLEERFARQENKTRRELKRLLYVGMTRARDMMITTTYQNHTLKWVRDLTGFDHPNVDANFWGTPDEILMQVCEYGDNVGFPDIEIQQVSILQKNGPIPQQSPMFGSPSKVAAVEILRTEIVKNFGYRIQRMHSGQIADNIAGDCLHSLFYSYTPDNQEKFLSLSEKVIHNYGLTGDLTHPIHIYNSATNLYGYLTGKYGTPEMIHKELPLQMVEAGVVYSGSADLVWETADSLILVDYKSYSGQIDHVINPDHDKYSGKYSGQLATYKEMLEKAHPGIKQVTDTLIYYAVIGIIVSVKL